MRTVLTSLSVIPVCLCAAAQDSSQHNWTDPKGFDPAVLDKVERHFEGKLDQAFIDYAAPHRSITQCGGDFEAPYLPNPDWDKREREAGQSETDGVPPALLEPLQISYDRVSWELGLESYCEARFDISDAGHPENVDVRCTLRPFVGLTRSAILDMRFAPANEDTGSVHRSNLTQPVAYCMPDPQAGS